MMMFSGKEAVIMRVLPHNPIDDLRRLERHKSHRPIAMRLRIVVLACQGKTAGQIAAATGTSRRPVQEWVRRYNAQGVEGLWDRPRSGQPTKLPRQQEQAFKKRLLNGPIQGDDSGLCTLRGKDAQRILANEFGVNYSLGGAIDLLHRLGLSCLKPRPRHRKNDPEAMRQWVQDAPLLSRSEGPAPRPRGRGMVPG
jgi:transposase